MTRAEAHNVAKRGDRSSQRSKLASLLANRSDTLIMLTATPHDGKGQSVASLMNMLDPTAIADEENYTKDDIEGLLIRRFKKDIQDQVSGAFKERVITIERCVASAREEAAYDIFADMKLQMDESRTRGKGLEFDHVFAVAVNKKVLPFGTRSDFEDDISLEEFRTGEKCLLYVALTRARKSACVTCYGGLSELIV